MVDPIKIVCSDCGSEDVGRDAWAEWDFASQEWVIRNVFDQAYCFACDCERTLTEVKETDGENSA